MGLASRQVAGFIARAAGSVIANAAANTAILDIHRTLDGVVRVHYSGTKGSLTSYTLTPQVLGPDGTWRTDSSAGAVTLTADATNSFLVNCKGCKQFRIAVTSVGTTTSSDLAIWFGWQEPGGALG